MSESIDKKGCQLILLPCPDAFLSTFLTFKSSKLSKSKPCSFHSKDGDNEFMNIIANEIGFQVTHIFYSLNRMYVLHCSIGD